MVSNNYRRNCGFKSSFLYPYKVLNLKVKHFTQSRLIVYNMQHQRRSSRKLICFKIKALFRRVYDPSCRHSIAGDCSQSTEAAMVQCYESNCIILYSYISHVVMIMVFFKLIKGNEIVYYLTFYYVLREHLSIQSNVSRIIATC